MQDSRRVAEEAQAAASTPEDRQHENSEFISFAQGVAFWIRGGLTTTGLLSKSKGTRI